MCVSAVSVGKELGLSGSPGAPDNALRCVERGNRLTVDGHIHFALGDRTIARYLSQQYEQEWQVNLGPGWSFGIP